ncbi:MAG: hypothetical protein H6706_10455 [Myxococcales bacterium]|nr:hypothetical protein [Myxococcales bacterium]
MEPVLIVAAVAGAGWIIAKVARVLEAGEQRWTDAVQAAAAQLGLAFHDRSSLERASAEGERAGIWLRLDAPMAEQGEQVPYTRAVAEVGLPDDVDIREARLGLRGPAWSTGDPAFDRRVRLGGDEALLRALLDEEARAVVLRGLGHGVKVAGGVIQIQRDGRVRDAAELVALVEAVAAVAAVLRPARALARLEAMALHDPDVELARAALRERVRLGPAPALLEAAASQPRPGLRLEAHRLRRDGAGLGALAEDDRLEPDVRLAALDCLDRLAPARVPAIAQAILVGAPDDDTAVAALVRLDDAATCPPTAVARALLARGPAVRLATAACLAHTAELADDLLLPLLDDADEVAQVAARTLGRRGTPAAVPALRARAARVFAGPVGQACEAAVAEIQSRVQGLRGGLAVGPAGEAGGLGLPNEGA